MVLETTRMSTRGQVIIPKNIRNLSNSKENDLFAVTLLDKETIVLKRLDAEKMLKEFQDIRAKVDKSFSDAEIDAAVKWARGARHKHSDRSKQK